jgi:DNA-binding XRE family transcriptional regulator
MTDDEHATVGGFIKWLREDRGWSMKWAARKIGCSPSTLHAIEHGTSKPSLLVAAKIAHAYDFSIEDLAVRILQEAKE